LDEFFTRSHGELSQFDYMAVTSSDGLIWHCLIGNAPVTQGASLAVPCDRLYLRETRWSEWQLPLFVRADCALSIDVDEAAVADRVLALLKEKGADETKHLILAESTDANSAEGQIQFLLLPNDGARSVVECLSYITTFGQGAASTASLASALTLGAVSEHNISAPPQVRELDGLLQDRAKLLVGEIQNLWENLRVGCQKNRIEMILTQVAIHVTRKAYLQHPATWRQFVDEVLKADEVLADLKIEALERWARNNAERDKIVKDLERRRVEVEGLIAARATEFEVLATELDGRMALTQASLGTLREAREQLDKSRERLAGVQATLQAELQELDKKIQELVTQRDAYRADQKKLENAAAEIQKKKREIEEARAQVAAKSVELEAMKPRLAEEQVALEQMRIPVAERQAQYEAERAAFEAMREAVSGAGSLLEKDWAVLNEEKLRFCGQPVPPPRRGIVSRIKSLWS
jgi:superoxide dismutase